jgi:hypothetical protein
MTPSDFVNWLDGFLEGLSSKAMNEQEPIKALRKISDQLTKVDQAMQQGNINVTYNPTTTNSTL